MAKNEKRRLENIKAKNAPKFGDRHRPLESFYAEDWQAACDAFSDPPKDFFGHNMWQSTRPFAAQALAEIRNGNSQKGGQLAQAMGAWIEGGSPEGNGVALMALLAEYDRLEEFLDSPVRSPAFLRRVDARNLMLRPQVKYDEMAKRALEDGVSFPEYKNDSVSDVVAAEHAINERDFVVANRRISELEGWTASWSTSLHGEQDPRLTAALLRAKMSMIQGREAVAIKCVEKAIEIDANCSEAWLILAYCCAEVKLDERAAKALKKVHALSPLENVAFADLSTAQVEEKIGVVDKSRKSFEQGVEHLANGDYDAAADFFLSALGTRKRDLLKGNRRTAAANALFYLGCAQRYEDAIALADRCLEKAPGFLPAREARSYAYAKTKKKKLARADFDASGVGYVNRSKPMTFADWSSQEADIALSPLAQDAEVRVERLSTGDHPSAARKMLAVLPELAPNDDLRFLIASGLIHGEKKRKLNDAWKWLEPYVVKQHQGRTYEIPASLLALDILTSQKRWDEIVALPIGYTSYIALTGYAYRRALPKIANAYVKLKLPSKALGLYEAYFEDHETEIKTPRTLFEYWALLRANKLVFATSEDEEFDKTSNSAWQRVFMQSDRNAKHIPDARELCGKFESGWEPPPVSSAEELTNAAWKAERFGDPDEAAELYLAASEMDPATGFIGLANAGNTLVNKRKFSRAWRYLETALWCGAKYPRTSRAVALDYVASFFIEQGKHEDALPVAVYAFEFAPSSERARVVETLYSQIGLEEEMNAYRSWALTQDHRSISAT